MINKAKSHVRFYCRIESIQLYVNMLNHHLKQFIQVNMALILTSKPRKRKGTRKGREASALESPP